MYLLKFRIIGHPLIPDSSWLEADSGLNILRTGQVAQAKTLLRLLQTINPPYTFEQFHPFDDFPSHTENQQYSRKIILSKKTAALAIFAASPELVKDLAALDPALYETDRIEIGRRRDHSRWMNFVELSGSARWSEIAPMVDSLLPHRSPEAENAALLLQTTIGKLRGTDRIKGDLAVQLKAQLQAFGTSLAENYQARLAQCLQVIDRAQHFCQAKAMVAVRLPLFLSITLSAAGQLGSAGADAASFTFLAARLREYYADQAGFAHGIRQLNLRLCAVHPELALQFREEGETLLLESAKGAALLPFTQLPPVEQLAALMTGLALLHHTLYGAHPIFLIDLSGLKLTRQEQVDLLKALRRESARCQCLVILDHDFLALCGNSWGKGETDGDPLVRLIDV